MTSKTKDQMNDIMADGQITDDELNSLSPEDLREMIYTLNEEVIEKEKIINDLKAEGSRKKRGKSSDLENQLSMLETQNNSLSLKIQDLEKERDQYREDLFTVKTQMSNMSEEKRQLEAQLQRVKQAQMDAQKELQDKEQANRLNQRKSQEVDKIRSDNQKEISRLLEENGNLIAETKEMTLQLEDLVKENLMLKELTEHLNEEREDVEAKHDNMLGDHQELKGQLSDFEIKLSKMSDQYHKSVESCSELQTKIDELNKAHVSELEKTKSDISLYKSQVTELHQQIEKLKDTTQMGELQRKADLLSKENNDLHKELETIAKDYEELEHENHLLKSKVVDFEDNFGDKVYEKVASEKESNRVLLAKLQSQARKLADEQQRNNHLESEKDSLSREKEELENWKIIFERGCGWQELTKHLNKVKEDNRRVGIAMEQLTRKLGEAMDTNSILYHAFERLKLEAGKPKDFMYPEYVLQQEMLGENAKLKSQIQELDDQVDSLENETIRLRKALKNQAGMIGEDGFKYQGMTSDMLVKVNEFASNLKEGNVELPVDDRSSSLLKENKRLKENIGSLELQIEKYERGLGMRHDTSITRTENSIRSQESEIFGLREDLQRMMKENDEIKIKMSVMQDEVLLHLKKHMDNAEGHAEIVHSTVSENTEKLLKELTLLRQSGGMMIPSHQQNQGQSRPVILRESSPAASGGGGGRESLSRESSQENLIPNTPRLGLGLGRPPTSGSANHFIHTALDWSTPTPNTNYAPSMNNIMTFQPTTPHGKQLLSKTLARINLPPEEWANEVKELNAQLIECIEQLYERENELEEQKNTVTTLEDTLVSVKQQMTAVYFDFTSRLEKWNSLEKQLKSEASSLLHERDELKLRLKKIQEMISFSEKANPEEKNNKLNELQRKVLVYEVNEAILSRKYKSLEEQLTNENSIRQQLEFDMAEMETVLKKRILYLEQYKLAVGSKLGRLQGRLDLSVPIEDFQALELELEKLREDHLNALSREVEFKINNLQSHETVREFRALKISMAHLKAELHESQAKCNNFSLQLEHQKDVTAKALVASNSSAELSSIISEMARFRGEASRLEVELIASNKRSELMNDQVSIVMKEIDALTNKLKEQHALDDQLITKESDARQELLALQVKYNGGLSREESEELRSRLDHLLRECNDAKRESQRNKELAEIAYHQAQVMGSYRSNREEEIKVLTKHCADLESRGDDDILIGRLQRQLISVKTTYKAFTRKYQILRTNMRQRELAQRVLEHSLDQKEEAVQTLKESHRLEVGALKRALRSVSASGNDNDNDKIVSDDIFDKLSLKGLTKEQEISMKLKLRQSLGLITSAIKKFTSDNPNKKLLTNGQKLFFLSEKVSALSGLAENSLKTNWELEETVHQLKGEIQDLTSDKDILYQRCIDLEAMTKDKANVKNKEQAVASRLVALSEEVRENKLITLQQRRHINVLRQEKKHLQSLLASIESDVENLEEGKIIAETKALLSDDSKLMGGLNKDDELNLLEIENIKNMDTMASEEMFTEKSKRNPRSLKIITSDHIPTLEDFDRANDSEELVNKLDELAAELNEARKESSHKRVEVEKLSYQVHELEQLLNEKESAINYYENVMHKEGLASLYHPVNEGHRSSPFKDKNAHFSMMKQDQDKLQEAANATIGSLKSLLEEKNRIIDKYRHKIEELQASHHKKSIADKHAEELLRKLEDDEKKKGLFELPKSIDHDEKAYKRLVEQVEAADEILSDKDKTINQLEQKLLTQTNQRERAEVRCGATIKEMESMKADMLTLVQQLRDAEEKCNDLTKSNLKGVGIRNDNELEKRLKSREEKLTKYRELILRLKNEFIKSEEDHAIKLAAMKESKSNPNNNNSVGTKELEELRSQISALKDGLKKAKEDLEGARKNREKLVKAKEASQEEVDRLETQLGRVEAQASAAQETLSKCRKDLEESKRKEIRLREKLKDLLETDSGTDKLASIKELTSKIETLEREGQVLRAQNISLRKAIDEETTHKSGNTTTDRDPHHHPSSLLSTSILDESKSKTTAAAQQQHHHPQSSTLSARPFGESKGYILGTSTAAGAGDGEPGGGNKDDLRSQLKDKWEVEKKLQKRVSQLEHRLKERMDEIEELHSQLKKAKDTAQAAMTAKEEMHKKLTSSNKSKDEHKKVQHDSPGAGFDDIDSYKQKIFELEEAIQPLRRKAEVEQPGELSILRHQVSTARTRIDELESLLQESEERRKKESAGGGGGPRSLRDSEDRFHREEKLRDELDFARRQRLDLEAAVLERDSKAMENRFDLEARTAENERLRRRLREVESALKNSTISGGKKSAWMDDKQPASSSKKEKELEGVIDAMKRVIDKLKSENDRMKRTGGPDERKVADMEKRAAGEKKRAEKLEEELIGLQNKLKSSEKISQELAQKQQQLISLRKAIKSKDEELASVRSLIVEAEDDKNQLNSRVKSLEKQLEESRQSSRAQGQNDRNRPDDFSPDLQLREKLNQQTIDLQLLKAELENSRREILSLKKNSPVTIGSDQTNNIELNKLKNLNKQLSEENNKLKTELSAFDLDFFEEIENLKFAHAEAIRKLRVYEGRS